jgi:hypothetical protein
MICYDLHRTLGGVVDLRIGIQVGPGAEVDALVMCVAAGASGQEKGIVDKRWGNLGPQVGIHVLEGWEGRDDLRLVE